MKYLRKLGFESPYVGGKHQFMVKGDLTLRIPNPHQEDSGKDLLSRILKQADITRKDWQSI